MQAQTALQETLKARKVLPTVLGAGRGEAREPDRLTATVARKRGRGLQTNGRARIDGAGPFLRVEADLAQDRRRESMPEIEIHLTELLSAKRVIVSAGGLGGLPRRRDQNRVHDEFSPAS